MKYPNVNNSVNAFNRNVTAFGSNDQIDSLLQAFIEP